MKKLIILLWISIFVLTACGPSQEEKEAAQRLVSDSLEKMATDSLKVLQSDSTKKQVGKDSLEKAPSNPHLKAQLAALQASYETACIKLESLKHHKFLRSKRKKEQQIEKQAKVVAQIQKQIASVKSLLK